MSRNRFLSKPGFGLEALASGGGNFLCFSHLWAHLLLFSWSLKSRSFREECQEGARVGQAHPLSLVQRDELVFADSFANAPLLGKCLTQIGADPIKQFQLSRRNDLLLAQDMENHGEMLEFENQCSR